MEMTMVEEEISVAVTVKFYSSQLLILLSLTSYPGTRPQTIPSQHSLPPLSSRPTPPKNSMCHGHPSHPRAQTQKKNTNNQTGLPNGQTAAGWQNALGRSLLA
jgi:hypothetical protein